MDKSFTLLDRNNTQKNANVVVKFNFEGMDYLVYSIDENEQNSQIFVSHLILNSEGKYFIDNILPEEKNKLNNIVYNIVILMPTEAQKGNSFEQLSKNLLDKFSVKLSPVVPILEIQEYYNSSSIALTNKLLVNNAIKFYEENVNKKVEEEINLPTWTAPMEVTAPTPVDVNINASEKVTTVTTVQPSENVISAPLNLHSAPVLDSLASNEIPAPVPTNKIDSEPMSVPVSMTEQELVTPNPQIQKLAIMSDPSLGIGLTQPNVNKNKKAGFANTKYIVIGTVCLVLAIVVVIVVYILISNMQ